MNPMYMGNSLGGYKSPEQYQNEYNSLMNTYRNMYGQMNNMTNQFQNIPSMPQAQNGGEFKYVDSYEEVENTPTRLDGVPTLFVLFNKGLMWSKKYEKGQHTIQAYQFGPINVGAKEPEKEVKEPIVENSVPPKDNTLEKILQKLESIEKNSKKVEVSTNGLDTTNLFSKRNNESPTSNI